MPWENDYTGNLFWVEDPAPATPTVPEQLPSPWEAAAAERPIGQEGLVNGSARDTQARITRERYADYVRQFIPIEDKLIASYNNPQQRAEQEVKAVGLSNTAFDTAAKSADIRAGRFGLNLKDDPAYARKMNMGRVAGQVDATNETRRHLNERDRQLMAGGLTSAGV